MVYSSYGAARAAFHHVIVNVFAACLLSLAVSSAIIVVLTLC